MIEKDFMQMTFTQTTVFYLAFFGAVAIYGFPRFFLRKAPTRTAKEIAKRRPKMRTIMFLYPAPLFVFPTILLFLLIAAGRPFAKPEFNEFFLFFPVIIFLGFYGGLFAIITGIFPKITRWVGIQFVDDTQNEFRWMAVLQIVLAILGILSSLAMFLFYPE